jgi:hypothetical protein
MTTGPVDFELYCVAHLVRPWGDPVRDLESLRDALAEAPDESLFRHTVQHRLRHPAADELPHDDLSAWIGAVIQDDRTAERVSYAVQANNANAGQVRAALLGVLDALPRKQRSAMDSPEESAFPFLCAIPVPSPTGVRVTDGETLASALEEADPSVWFWHLIETPWREHRRAPLLEWLDAIGEPKTAERLEETVTCGLPIDKARAEFARRHRRSSLARRLADASRSAEDVRREEGRRTVARLLRRNRRPASET